MLVNDTPYVSFPCSQAVAPYLRVKYDATYGLGLAGPEDKGFGTLKQRHIVSGLGTSEATAVVAWNATGTRKMVAAGALSAFETVFGAEGGKIDDTPNSNPIGIALEAATADGDYIEVLSFEGLGVSGDDRVGGIEIFEDFLGDWPAAGTAITANSWTKVETLGLGVISSDEANGVIKLSFDAVAEVAVAALYFNNSPISSASNSIFECKVAIYDIGDDAALDINFGVVGAYAADCDDIAESLLFHLNGAALSLCIESDDGTTEVAATDTLVDLVDDTYYEFQIDATDLTDVKFSYRAVGAVAWTRLLASATFDVSDATGVWTPLFHIEKSSNDTTADVRVDWVRFRGERA